MEVGRSEADELAELLGDGPGANGLDVVEHEHRLELGRLDAGQEERERPLGPIDRPGDELASDRRPVDDLGPLEGLDDVAPAPHRIGVAGVARGPRHRRRQRRALPGEQGRLARPGGGDDDGERAVEAPGDQLGGPLAPHRATRDPRHGELGGEEWSPLDERARCVPHAPSQLGGCGACSAPRLRPAARATGRSRRRCRSTPRPARAPASRARRRGGRGGTWR